MSGFDEKYAAVKARQLQILEQNKFDTAVLAKLEEEWFAGVEKLKEFDFIDSEHYINSAI